MRNKRYGIIVLGLLIILATLLGIVGPKLVEKSQEKFSLATTANTSLGINARGVVEAAEDVELSSQVRGVIARVQVEDGADVVKGQLLLEFDQTKIIAQLRQIRAALAVAKSRFKEAHAGYRSQDIAMINSGKERAKVVYDQAKDDFERQKRLFENDALTKVELNRAEERLKITEVELSGADANLNKHRQGIRTEEVDQARANLERARADVEYIESILKDYQIITPITGIVTERMRDPGEVVDIGTPLFRIVNPGTFRIRAELEETDMGKVLEGQPVEVTVEAFGDKIFRGAVKKVFPVVQKKIQKKFDPMSSFDINTQKIYVQLEDYTGLKNGMTSTVRFK